MNAFNSNFKDLKSNLKNMLLEGINAFEDGIEILDVDLEIDEHLTLDVLAKDAKGNPTVVLSEDTGEANLIDRILTTLCRLKKHRYLLQRIYRDHAFDFSLPPRILLLSSRFSDDFIEKIDFIVAGNIVPYEYSTLKIDDREYLTFSRRDIEEGGEIRAFHLEKLRGTIIEPTPEPAVSSQKAPKVIQPEKLEPKPQPAPKREPEVNQKVKKKAGGVHERFFHEAKKKILRISNEIVESVDGPVSRFKISDKVLVTLSKEKDELSVFLGDTTEKRIKIDSEDRLNEVLNLIFKRYFTAFSSISKS
jgi:hypothetical protein